MRLNERTREVVEFHSKTRPFCALLADVRGAQPPPRGAAAAPVAVENGCRRQQRGACVTDRPVGGMGMGSARPPGRTLPALCSSVV